MELGLAYTNEFDGLKSMTTFDTVPVTLYYDGLPYDLNNAKSVTLHIGSAKGYVGAMSLDITTDRSLFGQGIISFPANKTFMQQLPPDIYYIEIWVDTDAGNLIFPSKGVLPFTVDDNLLNTSQNGIYSMTLYNFASNINELTNIIENNQASVNKGIETIWQNISANRNSKLELENYQKDLTAQARKITYDYTEEGLGIIKQSLNTSGGKDLGVMNHRLSDIRKGISNPKLIKDTHNQTFHFSTPYGWLNDIQTIVRVKDHWNIYYLNNNIKDSEELASEWYVVQTTDFKTFSDAGVAVHRMPNLWGDVFTGSVIKNKQPDGHVINPNAPINGYLAFFCGHTPGMQQMYCAYSDDDAMDFHPLDGSLVLPRPSGADGFRDGKIYYNPTKQEVVMYMVQGSGNDGTEIHTYTSSTGEENTFRDTGILNLPPQTWNNDSPGAYECPNIIENITDKATEEVVDVLTLSGNTGPDGMGMFYIVGKVDENGIFQRKPNALFKRLDYGLDAYAGNFANELNKDGSVVNINWIGSWSRPYLDFMNRENNYHLGSFSLPRNLTLRNGILENDIIEPESDVLLHWYDTTGMNLHEKSNKSKITAKFNNPISNNVFTFDYGDGLIEVYVEGNKISIGQPKGIFPVPNGATCFLNNPTKELIFYLDKASLEIYVPSEKKILTHMMLTNNHDINFHSKNPINELIIRQFNEMDVYGSFKPVEPTTISTDRNLVNGVTKDDNSYFYRGDWNDDLHKLHDAKPGYYSLSGNKINAPKDFSGYGNVEVTHNQSDTFLTLRADDQIWFNQFTFGSWSAWKSMSNGGSNSFEYRGNWKDDLYKLTEALAGVYALPGNKVNGPDDFSGFGNVEVTHNDTDTFVVLKSEGKVWTNQFTLNDWVGWDKIAKESEAFVYRGNWDKDLFNLKDAKPGIYSLENNKRSTPHGFSGYGNVEVTHNKSDTFATLKSEGRIWTSQYTLGKWTDWTEITAGRDVNYDDLGDGVNNFIYRGNWTTDMANLTSARTGIYSVPGVFAGIPEDFSGYGNVEVTHNDSDTFITLKSLGDIWTNQFTLGKWIGWDKNVKAKNSFSYHGDWTDDLHKLTDATQGYYSLSGNKVNGPNDFSGFGNVEVTHNKSDTFVVLKSEGKIWTNQFTLDNWIGWDTIVKNSDSFAYHGDWTDDLNNLTKAKHGYYSLDNNKQSAPRTFSGYGNVEVTHNQSDTFITLKSEGNIWTNQFTLGKWIGWKPIGGDDDDFAYRGNWTDSFAKLTKAKTGIYAVPGNKIAAPTDFSGFGNVEVTHNEADTFVTLRSEGKLWINQYAMGNWIGWSRLGDSDNIKEIDNAFAITEPGVYTHIHGAVMANVPSAVNEVNDYVIYALGGKKRVKNSSWTRSYVSKLVLINHDGVEYTSYSYSFDKFTSWRKTSTVGVREIEPTADLFKLEGPAIYHSKWGYQDTLKNYPSGNGASTIIVEGLPQDNSGGKITVVDDWGNEFINHKSGDRWTGWGKVAFLDQVENRIGQIDTKVGNMKSDLSNYVDTKVNRYAPAQISLPVRFESGDAWGLNNALRAHYDVNDKKVYLQGFIKWNLTNNTKVYVDLKNVAKYIGVQYVLPDDGWWNGLVGISTEKQRNKLVIGTNNPDGNTLSFEACTFGVTFSVFA